MFDTGSISEPLQLPHLPFAISRQTILRTQNVRNNVRRYFGLGTVYFMNVLFESNSVYEGIRSKFIFASIWQSDEFYHRIKHYTQCKCVNEDDVEKEKLDFVRYGIYEILWIKNGSLIWCFMVDVAMYPTLNFDTNL